MQKVSCLQEIFAFNFAHGATFRRYAKFLQMKMIRCNLLLVSTNKLNNSLFLDIKF